MLVVKLKAPPPVRTTFPVGKPEMKSLLNVKALFPPAFCADAGEMSSNEADKRKAPAKALDARLIVLPGALSRRGRFEFILSGSPVFVFGIVEIGNAGAMQMGALRH